MEENRVWSEFNLFSTKGLLWNITGPGAIAYFSKLGPLKSSILLIFYLDLDKLNGNTDLIIRCSFILIVSDN